MANDIGYAPDPKYWPAERLAMFRQMRRSGMAVSEMGMKLGVSAARISQMARKLGFEQRSGGSPTARLRRDAECALIEVGFSSREVHAVSGRECSLNSFRVYLNRAAGPYGRPTRQMTPEQRERLRSLFAACPRDLTVRVLEEVER